MHRIHHGNKPLTLANASSCLAIPQIRFRFHMLMLLLHSLRYTNHGILVSLSSPEIPPTAHCAVHHSISWCPCISWGFFVVVVIVVVVGLSSKEPAGRNHGSSLTIRRRAMPSACGRMRERSLLQVVVRADMDLVERKWHVERRMSGGRDVSVGFFEF